MVYSRVFFCQFKCQFYLVKLCSRCLQSSCVLIIHDMICWLVESSDFVGQMVNVTVPAGKSSANFTVTILDDAILEGGLREQVKWSST